MPTKHYSDQEYRKTFLEQKSADPTPIHSKALERALDIRKFEIELYWKRAAYFWTFIAATLAGFVAVQASQSSSKEPLSVLLCNLGIAFSFAWLTANRGSKHWQENWENHVDMLEDSIQGPLYKVVLTRGKPRGWKEHALHLLTGPSPISVSKVNQLISLYVLAVWVGLLLYSLPPFAFAHSVHWLYAFLTGTTALLCVGFCTVGRTYSGGYWHRGTIRTAAIRNGESDA